MEISVVRKNKSYDKRKLVITINKKKYYAEPWLGWYTTNTTDIEIRTIIRDIVMDNLYWLVGKDCNIELWAEDIEDWDSGKRIYNTPLNTIPSSMFFDKEEKEKAFKSFYNN